MMTDKTFMIKKTDLYIAIMVFCTFKISYFTHISDAIYWMYLLLGSVIIFLGWVFVVNKKMATKTDFLVLAFTLVEWVSTIANNGSIPDLLIETETILLLHITCKISFEMDWHKYIQYARNYLLILTLINTVSAVICYPKALFYYDAFSPAFLLGGDNTSTRLYIITSMLCGVDIQEEQLRSGKKYLMLISIINFLIFSVIRDIGNGKVCSAVLLLAYVLFVLLKMKMPPRPIFAVLVFNYTLFVLLVIANKVNLFSFIIIKLLKRNLTLTTRTTIWQITMGKILEKPLLGNGYVSGKTFESFLPSIIGVNAHNTLLMVCFIGGVVLSAVFLLLMLEVAKKYDRATGVSGMWPIPVAFLAMFLRSQIEGGDASYLIFMVVFIDGISRFLISRQGEEAL